MDTQIAYYLIEEQLGKKSTQDGHISFVRLLADPRYCGISYVEKKEVRSLLKEDPQSWTYRPLSELMVRAAADDVRFLPYVFHKMMEKLSEESLWRLAVRGSLCCRCFCISDNEYADWPAIPSIPEFLNVDRDTLEDEILSILDVPPGKMGCVIGRKGSSILSIKESCKAEILISGSKGAPDKFGKYKHVLPPVEFMWWFDWTWCLRKEEKLPETCGFHHWTPEAGKESRSHVVTCETTLLLHLEARALDSYYPIIKLNNLK